VKKIIGILGGMGSMATLSLFKKFVEFSPSNNDRDYPEIIVHNNSRIPDRTQALLHGGTDPFPELLRSASMLENSGTDYIVIACATAHYYTERLQEKLNHAIIVSVIDETVSHIKRNLNQCNNIGILASTGAIKTRIWQDKLEKAGIRCTVLSDHHQREYFMEAIYGDKGLKSGFTEGMPKEKIVNAISMMIANGADSILGGCSEIPMIVTKNEVPVPFVDCFEELVKSVFLKINVDSLQKAFLS
jgi:aspartate racemase